MSQKQRGNKKKTVFPLHIKSCNADSSIDLSKVTNALYNFAQFDHDFNIPNFDEQCAYMERQKVMTENPISEGWLHYPAVSEVQASYLLFESLLSIFDVIWCEKTFVQKESEIQLQNTPFSHQQFIPMAFASSRRLRFIEVVDNTVLLCQKLVEEDPSILIG